MSKTKNDDVVTPIVEAMKKAWRHRPEIKLFGKTIIKDNSIAAAILDVIDELDISNKSGLKPVMVEKPIETPYGSRVILSLPPGINAKYIKDRIDHFEEQVRSKIFIDQHWSTLNFDIYTKEIESVTYDFNPANYPDYHLPTPIGIQLEGQNYGKLLVIDITELPHMFTAGNTGSGKTTALMGMSIAAVLTNNLRQNVQVVCLDYKGVDFGFIADHALICDADICGDALDYLSNKELNRRMKILRQDKRRELRRYSLNEMPFPWIVLIVDELTEMNDDKKAQKNFNRLCRMGRAPGFCIIACTQRPSATTYKDFSDTRALFQGRLCFNVPKRDDSRIALDNDAAYYLPFVKGRAIYQADQAQAKMIQTMHLTDEHAERILKNIDKSKNMAKVVNWQDEQRPKRLPPR